jgi:AraC-like DNA-binding protein
MGRPRARVKLDADQIRDLAAIGCTDTEIAQIARISEKTLQRRFVAALKEGRGQLRMSIRRKQLELALAGNTALLIFLGKVYLHQKEQKDGGSDSVTVQIVTDE